MRIKDHTDMVRHLTDSFNIPEARRMIAENPALSREQFAEGQLVQPGPGRQGYSGVKELPDGGYSVRSKYKADLGNWPTGEKKAKTHYFDTKQEALDFKKEAKTQPIRATESSQKVHKNRSKWVKNFYKDNIDNFKVSDYDKFTKKMAKEWAKESKKGDYIDIEKRVRLTDDMGLPLVREETTIFDLTAAKKGQVETHGPSKAFYKRAFFKGKLERDKDLKKGVKKYMEWATEKRPAGGPAAYKATRADWLKAGEDFIDKDVLYFLGEGYDEFKYGGHGRGNFFDIMSKEYPELFEKYHAKVNLSKGTYEKTLKEVAELAGRDFNEVLNNIRKENQAVKKLLGIDNLPSDMVFGYSGEHVGGLKTAIINNDKAFANKVLDNVIASTRGRNTELGWKLLEKPKNRLVREFKNAKTLDAKSKIITRLNDLVQKVDPGSVKWKINKGKLDFTPLIKQKTTAIKASSYLEQKGVRKFLQDAGIRCPAAKGGDCPIEDYRKSFNEVVERAAAGDKPALTKLQKFTQTMKKLKGPLKWTGYGLLGEIGFMVPFAVGDYTTGKSWKRILGNASDWGFGPMFGQSEDEEIIANLPEGSLGAEGQEALAASERSKALEARNFPKGRIGMDPKRFQEAQTKVIEEADLDFLTKVTPFMEGPRNQYLNIDKADQSMRDWAATQELIKAQEAERIQERRDRGFIAEEGWEKNFRRNRMGGGIMSLKK